MYNIISTTLKTQKVLFRRPLSKYQLLNILKMDIFVWVQYLKITLDSERSDGCTDLTIMSISFLLYMSVYKISIVETMLRFSTLTSLQVGK